MSKEIDRASEMLIYNQLLESPFMTIHELSKKLSMDRNEIEIAIISLREMYRNGEIDKYICGSANGYYIVDLEEFNHRRIDRVKQDKSNNNDIITLDIKNKLSNQNKLLKINLIGENEEPNFTITIGLEKKE